MYEVLIFVQPGCPACHDLQAIARPIGDHYGSCVRYRFVDVTQEALLADTMRVRETPTVIGSKGFVPTVRMVGAENAQKRLTDLYGRLLQGGGCPVASWTGDV